MISSSVPPVAPELSVSRWFNTDRELTLRDLTGRVVVIEAFQMLCPGCVTHGLPQATRVQETFGDDVTVIGLHTVFEHHAAMTPVALEAFLHEYRIGFPVGVDVHEPGVDTPLTMRRLGLRGTPSLVVVDRAGRVRLSSFGAHDDLALGALLGRLIDEPPTAGAAAHADADADADASACDERGCSVPRSIRP